MKKKKALKIRGHVNNLRVKEATKEEELEMYKKLLSYAMSDLTLLRKDKMVWANREEKRLEGEIEWMGKEMVE
jgi:hypothetical protein